MKRALPLLALLIPLIAFSAPIALVDNFAPYDQPLATIHLECKKGPANYVELGTAPGTATSIPFTFDLAYGEQVDCRLFATLGDKTSPRSEVASYRHPFPDLNAPQNQRIQAAP